MIKIVLDNKHVLIKRVACPFHGRPNAGMADFLREHHVTRVYIAGLATDYCVKYTAIDAAQLGFEAYVIADACRGSTYLAIPPRRSPRWKRRG